MTEDTDRALREAKHVLSQDNDILKAELARCREALEMCFVGGNHLAAIIGNIHPEPSYDVMPAFEYYGQGYRYEVWCCWNSLMLARAALAQKKE